MNRSNRNATQSDRMGTRNQNAGGRGATDDSADYDRSGTGRAGVSYEGARAYENDGYKSAQYAARGYERDDKGRFEDEGGRMSHEPEVRGGPVWHADIAGRGPMGVSGRPEPRFGDDRGRYGSEPGSYGGSMGGMDHRPARFSEPGQPHRQPSHEGQAGGAWNAPKSEPRPFAGKGPKGYVRADARMHEDICEHLSEGHVDASDIEVTVADGVVRLSGSVPDKHTKRYAEDIAEECRGVKSVENELRVVKASDRAGTTAASPGVATGVGQDVRKN